MSHERNVRPNISEGGTRNGCRFYMNAMALCDWGHLRLTSHDGDSRHSRGRATASEYDWWDEGNGRYKFGSATTR